MGGSKSPTIIQPPAPPSAPSLGATIQDYVANYPQLVAQQQQYGPELAQLDYQLQQQYAPQYAALEKQINESLYPKTAGIQEQLATQASQGMNEGLPADLRQQYVSDFNAGIGMNVNSPIGVSDRNVALTQLNKQWGDYYRNLGLSVAGRQPLAQGQQGIQYQNPNQGLDAALGFASQNFGTTMQGYDAFNRGTLAYKSAGLGTGIGAGAGALAGGAFGQPLLGAQIGGMIGGSF